MQVFLKSKNLGTYVIFHGITIFKKLDGIRIWYCGTNTQQVYSSTLFCCLCIISLEILFLKIVILIVEYQ